MTGDRGAQALEWTCDWTPDELNPGPECPYCEGRVCARFDGLNCTHNRQERHGYERRGEHPAMSGDRGAKALADILGLAVAPAGRIPRVDAEYEASIILGEHGLFVEDVQELEAAIDSLSWRDEAGHGVIAVSTVMALLIGTQP